MQVGMGRVLDHKTQKKKNLMTFPREPDCKPKLKMKKVVIAASLVSSLQPTYIGVRYRVTQMS